MKLKIHEQFSIVIRLGILMSFSLQSISQPVCGDPFLVKNINPSGNALPDEFIEFGGSLYFAADDGTNGTELWKTDGTTNGTLLVKDINPTGDSSPEEFIEYAGSLYFAANDGTSGRELWKTDGTTNGTVLVKNIDPIGHSSPAGFTKLGALLFFRARNQSNEIELWKTDGTESGTVLVKDINPSGTDNPLHLTEFEGSLYFQAFDVINGRELWKTDGTAVGTVLVKDINPTGDGFPLHFTEYEGNLFFRADDGTNGIELWKTDGTTIGTVLVKDINLIGNGIPFGFVEYKGDLFFRADDGTNGLELWKTDGSPEGTGVVKDINPTGNSNPSQFTEYEGNLFFRADDGTNGHELWKTDGTTIGTVLVKDINPTGGASPSGFTEFGGQLYFGADDGINGRELWRSDGTSLGTALVSIINPSGNSNPVQLSEYRGSLFFRANDGTNGTEPWILPCVDSGQLVISEIMYHPTTAGEAWEWVEIYNSGASTVDLSGYVLDDNNGVFHDSANITIGTIEPHSTAILYNADAVTAVDFIASWGPDINLVPVVNWDNGILNNSTDQIGLWPSFAAYSGDHMAHSKVFAGVTYDDSAPWPVDDGLSSIYLTDLDSDPNEGSNWALSVEDTNTPTFEVFESRAAGGNPGTDIGSPGPGFNLVISEIMYRPDSPNESWEWVEIYNSGSVLVDLTGYVFDGNNGVAHDSANILSGTIGPGETGILYNIDEVTASDFADAWGPDINLIPTSNWSAGLLNNSGDQLGLWPSFASYIGDHITQLNVVASVSYDVLAPWPVSDGFGSIYLTDLSADENDGTNWALSTAGMSTPAFESYKSYISSNNTGNDIGSPGPGYPIMEIFEIQDSTLSSPFENQVVRADTNVVTAITADGFFMQTPSSRSDNKISTSDGIFVKSNLLPTVDIGDLVNVKGPIVEFFGFTEFLDPPDLSIIGVEALPAPVIFDETSISTDPNNPTCGVNNFECFEGMLIEVMGGVVTSPSDNFDVISITPGQNRTFREIGVEFPGLPLPIPTWDGNPEVFELDPDGLGMMNQKVHAGSSFDAQGVLAFAFGDYQLWPSVLTITPAILPVAVPDRNPGSATIGSLNLFRLFDDIDDPVSLNIQGGERNDQVVSTTEYMRRRTKLSNYILDVLKAPEILAIQEVEKIEVLQDLVSDISTIDPMVVYTSYLIEGNDIGTIDNGFLVREDLFNVNTITQVGLTETFVNPMTLEDDILHDRPPLLLEGQFIHNDQPTLPISVLCVHNRSLASIDGPSGERIRAKRLAQSQSIATRADLIQSTGASLVVIGDMNAFEFTDGYVDVVGQISGDFDPSHSLLSGPDLVDPNLINQVLSLPTEDRYSYIFEGNSQVLDHALTSMNLNLIVNNLAFGRGNADAINSLMDDETTPMRSSDHDGLVLFLEVAPLPEVTWVGSTNSDWNEASNWSNGIVPTSVSPVVIPDVTNDPIIFVGEFGNSYSISIQSGGHLSVQNTATLNIISSDLTVSEAGMLTMSLGAVLNN